MKEYDESTTIDNRSVSNINVEKKAIPEDKGYQVYTDFI